MKFKHFFVITFFAFFSRVSFAEQVVISSFNVDKKSTLGLGYSWGSLSGDVTENFYNRFGLTTLFYDYRISRHLSMDVRYFKGDTGDAFCIVTCREGIADNFLKNDIKFSGVSIGGKGALKLSRRWTVFARLGMNSFDTTRYGNYRGQRVGEGLSGTGLYAAGGVEFRTFNGVGFSFEVQHFGLDDIRANAYSLNLSYQF